MNEKTQQGIAALRGGDKNAARALLTASLKEDPNDAAAWLWLTGALDTDEERAHCLRQVLRIEPNNAAAARGLNQVLARIQKTPPPEEAAAPAASVFAEEAAPLETAASPETPVQEAAPASAQPFTELPPDTVTVPIFDAEGMEETLVPEDAWAASQPEQPGIFVESLETAAPEMPAAEETAPSEPAAPQPHRKRSKAEIEGLRVIFHTRPSVAPALGAFWLFLAGAGAVGILLRGDPMLALGFAFLLGVVLNAIVVYAVIRNIAARYELTNQHLTLRFRGRKVRVPVSSLFSAEYRQTAVQRMLGTGDVIIEASANGELTHLRMRNIPEVSRRTAQLQEQIRESKT